MTPTPPNTLADKIQAARKTMPNTVRVLHHYDGCESDVLNWYIHHSQEVAIALEAHLATLREDKGGVDISFIRSEIKKFSDVADKNHKEGLSSEGFTRGFLDACEHIDRVVMASKHNWRKIVLEVISSPIGRLKVTFGKHEALEILSDFCDALRSEAALKNPSDAGGE